MLFLLLPAGALASFINPGIRLNLFLAKVALVLSAVIIASYGVTLFRILPANLSGFVSELTGGMLGVWSIVSGYVWGGIIFFTRRYENNPSASVPKIHWFCFWSFAVFIAGSYVRVTIGKAMHHEEMEAFFQASGLPVWLHYLIMVLEVLGAAGILLHTKIKTGIPAALGLSLIMAGAIFVHFKNGDPFSDAYDAAMQLTCLICFLLLLRVQP